MVSDYDRYPPEFLVKSILVIVRAHVTPFPSVTQSVPVVGVDSLIRASVEYGAAFTSYVRSDCHALGPGVSEVPGSHLFII